MRKSFLTKKIWENECGEHFDGTVNLAFWNSNFFNFGEPYEMHVELFCFQKTDTNETWKYSVAAHAGFSVQKHSVGIIISFSLVKLISVCMFVFKWSCVHLTAHSMMATSDILCVCSEIICTFEQQPKVESTRILSACVGCVSARCAHPLIWCLWYSSSFSMIFFLCGLSSIQSTESKQFAHRH